MRRRLDVIIKALILTFWDQLHCHNLADPFAPFAPLTTHTQPDVQMKLPVAKVTARANELAVQAGLALPGGPTYTNEKRVGRTLSRLRLKEGTKASGEGRSRIATLRVLDSVARTHGLDALLPATVIPGVDMTHS